VAFRGVLEIQLDSESTEMNETWNWPGEAKAAVSLSYDDGMDSGLDHAIPDLEEAGFRGTFYLATNYWRIGVRKTDWRTAFLNGHEIGNHTVHHPCRGRTDGHNLETYTPKLIREEIRGAYDWLNRHIGVDNYRTLAYPCGHHTIGNPPDEESFLSAVGAYHFAARLAGGGINDPAFVARNPLKIKAEVISYPHGKEVEPFIEYCEQTAKLRGWGVIVFHGIGDQWFTTERVVHQQLIEHLGDKRFWVAPIREVARHILYSR
jgi:peptidoglycan/xylan/chitin deacetylase (PgdA/CDA1 family)